MDRRKNLLNSYERAALRALQNAVGRCGAEVFTMVRVADVLVIQHSGLNDEAYDYALTSHFDFVIAKQDRGLFAIEFDGAGHFTEPNAMRRDSLKRAVCSHLQFPLLRIDSQYLRPVSETATVLDWLISLWFQNLEYETESNEQRVGEYVGFYNYQRDPHSLMICPI